eukprot:4944001-Amphidinium_carterae.2
MQVAPAQSYVRSVANGFTDPSINCGLLLKCLKACQEADSLVDDEYWKLHKCFLVLMNFIMLVLSGELKNLVWRGQHCQRSYAEWCVHKFWHQIS